MQWRIQHFRLGGGDTSQVHKRGDELILNQDLII